MCANSTCISFGHFQFIDNEWKTFGAFTPHFAWYIWRYSLPNIFVCVLLVQGGYSTIEVRWSMRVPRRTFVVVFHWRAYSNVLPLSVYRKVRSSTIGLELWYFVYVAHVLFLVSGITTLFICSVLLQVNTWLKKSKFLRTSQICYLKSTRYNCYW